MTQLILGLDPGPTESAICLYEPGQPGRVLKAEKMPNREMRQRLYEREWAIWNNRPDTPLFVVEYMRPRGMPTSAEEMDTMFELGRLVQCWQGHWQKINRMDVKLALCGKVNATDANIRRALIDRWGGDKAIAGTKKCPVCKGKGWIGRLHVPCPRDTTKLGPLCGGAIPAGPLHNISGDCWSSLAICVAWSERMTR